MLWLARTARWGGEGRGTDMVMGTVQCVCATMRQLSSVHVQRAHGPPSLRACILSLYYTVYNCTSV